MRSITWEQKSNQQLTKMEPYKLTRAESLTDNKLQTISEDDRTVEFSFSSEAEVQRYFGTEVLDHRATSVNLARLNDSAPLLWGHDPDKVIGVVERAYIDEKKRRGYASVRFSRNDFAQSIYQDVQDGILRNVSVGYQINEMEETDGVFRAVNWTPMELSFVGIPADESVGVSRKAEPLEVNNIELGISEGSELEEQADNIRETQTVMSETPNLEETRQQAVTEERNRIASIRTLCDEQGLGDETAQQLINNGSSIDDARAVALEQIKSRKVEKVASVNLNVPEKVNYSVSAGIRAALTGDWSSREAGYVRELSQECELKGSTRTGKNSFFVPYGALSTRATYVTSTDAAGGNLVEQDYLENEYIDVLRNTTVMGRMGVRFMTGLQGNVEIPRMTSASTAYYLSSETAAITQSEGQFDQVTMSPKHLAALSKASRQAVLQAQPAIEGIIRDDLQRTMNLEMDRAILNGSGSSGQPTGIMQTSGLGSVAIGTNGGAVDLDDLVDLEREVAIDNALLGNPGYLTNPKVIAGLKKLKDSNGAYLYNTNLEARGRGGDVASINGYRIESSNQVPSNLTKGSGSNLSAMLFGDFSSCMVGIFGPGIELTVGENEDDFAKVLTSIRATMHFDVAVRHAESFALISDIVTS